MLNLNYTLSNESLLVNQSSQVAHKVPKALAYCLVFFISVVGNSFIVWTIYKDHRLGTAANFLVAGMAVSDLLYTILKGSERSAEALSDHTWLIDGDFGLALCGCIHCLGYVALLVSVYSCVFVAIDRYCAVARPMKGGFSGSRLKCIVPGIWIFAAVISAPCAVVFALRGIHELAFCHYGDVLHSVYVNAFFFSLAGMAIPIVAIIYTLVVCRLRRHGVPGQRTDSVGGRGERRNGRVLKVSVAIVILPCVALLCYGTFVVCISRVVKKITILQDLSFAMAFVVQLSFCCGFFICLVFGGICGENFGSMLSKCCCACSVFGAGASEGNRVVPDEGEGVVTVIQINTLSSAVILQ